MKKKVKVIRNIVKLSPGAVTRFYLTVYHKVCISLEVSTVGSDNCSKV